MGKLIMFPGVKVPVSPIEQSAVHTSTLPKQEPVPAPSASADITDLTRDAVTKRIKTALKARSGREWSVTGGKGTGYGWIRILPAKKYLTGDYGYMTEADQALLAKLLGLEKPVHFQGVSIPASSAYYREYIDRAEGRKPRTHGEQYWD